MTVPRPGAFVWLTTLCVALLLGVTPAQAQTVSPETTDETAPVAESSEDVDTIVASGWNTNDGEFDYADWESVAERTEDVLLRNQARPFVLERLRIEIAGWRDVFATEMQENSGRLITVESQIAALGPEPADGESEAATVTSRRAALIAQRDELAAPGLLATEAHARASGLIRETETQLRARQTEDLMQRNESPLNPAQWRGAINHLWTGAREFASEISQGTARFDGSASTINRLMTAFVAIAVAGVLFWRARRVTRSFLREDTTGARGLLYEFGRTVADALLPLLGLTALTYGLAQLDVFGPLGETVLNTLPLSGSMIILSAWLGRQFFPLGDRFGPLHLDAKIRRPLRRYADFLACVAGLWIPFDAFLKASSEEEGYAAVLAFPIIVLLSLVLFRFATLLRTPPSADAGAHISQGRTRRVIGRVAQVVAVVSPVLSGFGYGAAAEELLFPTILTLGLIGVVVYLQTLAYRVFEVFTRDSESQAYALAPVVIGTVLLIIAAPILALVWGAQRTDLLEYWTRFTEGVKFGDTQVSPSDFMWFAVIFTFGYLLTQFIKSTLKVTVLPRTKLDLGAQNAIVAGFGYVGIFLTGVIAITSAGIDLSNLAIVAGALSVGIGFGLQTIVSNFVSGIILLIERPISEGDWIEVGDRMGYVRDISVRSTRIETFDQTDVIVPNADLVSNQVINWTRGNLVGRLILPIGVGYNSDPDAVLAILKDIAESHPMVVMSPPPAVHFMNFGADALEFEIRAILRDINFVVVVRSEMNFEISRRFAEAGIEIPFAQRDIWLRNPEVLRETSTDATPVKNTPAADALRVRDNDADTDVDAGDADGDSN